MEFEDRYWLLVKIARLQSETTDRGLAPAGLSIAGFIDLLSGLARETPDSFYQDPAEFPRSP